MEAVGCKVLDKLTDFNEIFGENVLHTNLAELKVGNEGQIIEFIYNDEVIKKIEAMGLREGKRIMVMRKLGRVILIKTGNSRIIITSDIAAKIKIK